ncbi:hypothetical protein ACMHYO_20605 [Allopusillimonas ginsengisoli]
MLISENHYSDQPVMLSRALQLRARPCRPLPRTDIEHRVAIECEDLEALL